ncbi:uncharacterized protein LOC132556981 [Ylistrum balloti]|uniref:uncharacterized protein LOC132556981 n=1 Tax=Ylistrum balloti TaxID=509963 RepID=UPI0029057E51|nr:uncharacterized protein LOC132556981 [Ylistrum balloti]
MMRSLFTLVLVYGVIHVIKGGGQWSYEGSTGPGNWGDVSEICDRNSQSPIDIPDQVYYNPELGGFNFNNYDITTYFTLRLHNNGHGATVDIASGTRSVTVSGGGLNGIYKAAQFHFHWGSDDNQGSEHTVNGRKYPMELHIVHYNTKYENISVAIDKPDGLAVLGAFFEISSADNPDYSPIVGGLSEIPDYKDEKALQSFDLMKLLPASTTLGHFYRYQGSLTTPNCYESVTWTVFEATVPISGHQLEQFRTLKDNQNKTTVNNYRPVQPLNGRKVYISYQPNPASWTYVGAKGLDYWSSVYPICADNSQSPIDLPQKSLMAYRSDLGLFDMTNYDNATIHEPSISNNGHGVQVNFGGNVHVTTRNGGLPGTFKLAQFHFHWGANNGMGSEHTYNGKAYPMEVHFVHYNMKYGSLTEAVDKADGLAVFGFFFEVGHTLNCNYNPVVDNLHLIKYPKTSASIDSFNIRYMMTEDMSRYYRYKGSLTTPPCYESVTWTVFEETIKISSEQLAKFREVFDTDGKRTVNNYRPPLPLETRIVYVSYDNYLGTSAAPSISATQFLITLLVTVAVMFR